MPSEKPCICARRCAAARSTRACHSSVLHSDNVFGETRNCMRSLPEGLLLERSIARFGATRITVVPAKAGTHTAESECFAKWPTPFAAIGTFGYGSRRSPGRQRGLRRPGERPVDHVDRIRDAVDGDEGAEARALLLPEQHLVEHVEPVERHAGAAVLALLHGVEER